LDNQQIDVNAAQFSVWVSEPSNISNANAPAIESMAGKFPYCQMLQLFVARSAWNSNPTDNSVLAKASLYAPNRKVLFNLINHPERLQAAAAVDKENETYYEVIEDDDYSADLTIQQPEPETQADTVSHQQVVEEDQPGLEKPQSETSKITKETVDMNAREEEEKTILENIAATDFFTFDEKLDVIPTDQKEETSNQSQSVDTKDSTLSDKDQFTQASEINDDLNEVAESSEVARYDDDSMPYSFLWWLHKTRKEHADTYQPYVEFKLDTNRRIKKTSGPELNQQMIENIFHLQSPLDELERTAAAQTVAFELKRKEEKIIEKFIRDEPQIHPPSPDKLDLENKARKSAEDPNDLVSETLAAIYTEQMLFHKAIDTYQKLSLKFPEKKGYFDDQISELQKKIN
jgi:hypothetical protein